MMVFKQNKEKREAAERRRFLAGAVNLAQKTFRGVRSQESESMIGFSPPPPQNSNHSISLGDCQ
jgi:hypothetical protein